jgi:hypothetical protein
MSAFDAFNAGIELGDLSLKRGNLSAVNFPSGVALLVNSLARPPVRHAPRFHRTDAGPMVNPTNTGDLPRCIAKPRRECS